MITVREWVTADGHKVTVTHTKQPTYQYTEYRCECGHGTVGAGKPPRRAELDLHAVWTPAGQVGRKPV